MQLSFMSFTNHILSTLHNFTAHSVSKRQDLISHMLSLPQFIKGAFDVAFIVTLCLLEGYENGRRN